MIFEFDQQPVFMQNIQVQDIGNVAMRCTNEKQQEYYLVTKTYLGKTAFLKFGPVYGGVEALVDNMELVFKKFDYKESTIVKEINKCLNDGRNGITKVELISEWSALSNMPTPESFTNSL